MNAQLFNHVTVNQDGSVVALRRRMKNTVQQRNADSSANRDASANVWFNRLMSLDHK